MNRILPFSLSLHRGIKIEQVTSMLFLFTPTLKNISKERTGKRNAQSEVNGFPFPLASRPPAGMRVNGNRAERRLSRPFFSIPSHKPSSGPHSLSWAPEMAPSCSLPPIPDLRQLVHGGPSKALKHSPDHVSPRLEAIHARPSKRSRN